MIFFKIPSSSHYHIDKPFQKTFGKTDSSSSSDRAISFVKYKKNPCSFLGDSELFCMNKTFFILIKFVKAEQEQQFRHLSFTTPQDIKVENPSVSSGKLAGKMGPSPVMIQKNKK